MWSMVQYASVEKQPPAELKVSEPATQHLQEHNTEGPYVACFIVCFPGKKYAQQ